MENNLSYEEDKKQNSYCFKSTKFKLDEISDINDSDKSIIDFANMRWDNVYHDNCLEHFGKVNWLKGALYCADKITTVSPHYAQEILTQDGGEGMDYTLRGQAYKLCGILNGTVYDKKVFDIQKKPEAKAEIQKLFGVDVLNLEIGRAHV